MAMTFPGHGKHSGDRLLAALRSATNGPHRPMETTTMTIELKGDQLVITVDVSDKALKAAPKSKSGKTRVVATTRGFSNYGKVAVGLNVTTEV